MSEATQIQPGTLGTSGDLARSTGGYHLGSILPFGPPVLIVGALAAGTLGFDSIQTESSPQWPAPHKAAEEAALEAASTSSVNGTADVRGGMTVEEFVQGLAEIYASLLAKQQPLGAECSRIWDENIDKLYES